MSLSSAWTSVTEWLLRVRYWKGRKEVQPWSSRSSYLLPASLYWLSTLHALNKSLKDLLIFALGGSSSRGPAHQSLHFPRPRDKVTIRNGGQPAWSPLLTISPPHLWLQTRPACPQSCVLAGCCCRAVWEDKTVSWSSSRPLQYERLGGTQLEKVRELLLFSFFKKKWLKTM